MSCPLAWWAWNFQPSEPPVEIRMFLYFNSLADHSRNISVFLSDDVGFIKSNITASAICLHTADFDTSPFLISEMCSFTLYWCVSLFDRCRISHSHDLVYIHMHTVKKYYISLVSRIDQEKTLPILSVTPFTYGRSTGCLFSVGGLLVGLMTTPARTGSLLW